MKIWVVVYSDGYDCSDVFIEAYTEEVVAEERAAELNAQRNRENYYVYEYELNTKENV